VTIKEREDRFIERCRKEFGGLSWESEQLLRWGFGSGALELSEAAYVAGMAAQRTNVLAALGAAAEKQELLP
jgi:hypothetical protein